ncbi:methyltransferase domain-containing protein [Luteibacter sp. PPL201]|uniref:Methyltransferase domain-containing protein n=1 Tax=Luteibacter sahnii TaxID=3021977 RepID=A0ABT6B9Q9_9GAMM|nr:methyltransferase domain-containing protein [Luteibacter sp. PPL193]MDY1546816.1 methyltransferase domain-containing protein [Luteibacter sp. PPL193]
MNSDYWRSRDGAYYLSQQLQRSEAGNPMYRQQENWLGDFIAERAAFLGRPLKILDFGCGFGRMTRYFANNPNVIYHGYDFSESMVAPLRADLPAGIDDTRIRVAPSVDEVFPSDSFDLIFTIAVLIHNAPENAISLTWRLLEKLADGGSLCLIENMLTSFSMRENNWHGGCWVHDHVGPFVSLWDVDVHRGIVDHQDIYLFRRPKSGAAGRLSVIENGVSREVGVEERKLLGLPRVEAAVRGLETEVEAFAVEQAKTHDAAEDLRRAIVERDELRETVATLNQTIASLQEKASSLSSIQGLRKRVENAMLGLDGEVDGLERDDAERFDERHLFAPVQRTTHTSYQWNAARDTEWAHADVRFDRVCHVFHQEWFGMRAAAGALPGRKLAVTAHHVLTPKDISDIADTLRQLKVDRLVVHGFSAPMEAFVRAIRASGFDHLYLVWHGAAAMWVFEGERKLAEQAMSLVRKGIFRRMQGMRRGMDEVIGSRAYAPQLLNLAPNVPASPMQAPRAREKRIVLSPSWNLLHKNLVTNLLAAQFNDRVGEFWTMANDMSLDRRLASKLRVLGARTGRAMLDTMRSVDLVSNVSIVDCHPMVDQEALAMGVPCLRGPLFLDALEDHPYVTATEVKNPLSVHDVSAAMNRVFDIGTGEMQDMIVDYARGIRKVSLDRYTEFLELN